MNQWGWDFTLCNYINNSPNLFRCFLWASQTSFTAASKSRRFCKQVNSSSSSCRFLWEFCPTHLFHSIKLSVKLHFDLQIPAFPDLQVTVMVRIRIMLTVVEDHTLEPLHDLRFNSKNKNKKKIDFCLINRQCADRAASSIGHWLFSSGCSKPNLRKEST